MYVYVNTFEVLSLIVPALDNSVTADTAAVNPEGSDSFQPKKSKPATVISLKIETPVGICTPAVGGRKNNLNLLYKKLEKSSDHTIHTIHTHTKFIKQPQTFNSMHIRGSY